jgi:hypothetical protein
MLALAWGCEMPSAHTFSRNYGLRQEVPVDPPRMTPLAEDECVEGGRLFKYYCGSCHNARPLGERPLSNYHVAIAHMRDQAYLTGKEYRQIIMFLRRWQEVGPPTPAVEPSPKRLIFSQPIAELRPESPRGAPPPNRPGAWQNPGTSRTPAPLQGGGSGDFPPLPVESSASGPAS